MLWASVVVGTAGLLVASYIATEHGGEPSSLWTRTLGALRKARSLAERTGGWSRELWDRRAAHRSQLSFAIRSSARGGERGRTDRVQPVDWRERLVAVMALILFIVFLSALFAGALAAAALKIGHFHS